MLLLPVEQFRRFVAACPLARTLRAHQTVEPVEERLEVGEWFLVVHVVFDTPAPERRPVVRHERKIVADVGLDADQHAELHEAPVGHWVRAEDPGRGGSERADSNQLPGVKVLRHPAVGGVVLVVDTVHVLVQEADLVVREMPDIILEVKHGQSQVLVDAEIPQGRGDLREHGIRGPHPLRHGDRKQVQQMVPQRQQHGLPDTRPGGGLVWLYLIFLDPLPLSPIHVDVHPWHHHDDVETHGEYYREQWRFDVIFQAQGDLPQRLQDTEHPRGGTENFHPRYTLDEADILQLPESVPVVPHFGVGTHLALCSL